MYLHLHLQKRVQLYIHLQKRVPKYNLGKCQEIMLFVYGKLYPEIDKAWNLLFCYKCL